MEIMGYVLPDLTHGDTEQANANLNACNDIEDFQNAGLNKPMVGTPGQTERKDILEYQQAREGFDGDVPLTTISVQRFRKSYSERQETPTVGVD